MTYEPLAAPRHDPMVAGHDIAVSDRGRQSSIAKADSRRSGALHVQHAGSRRSAHTVASSKASPSSSLRASSGLATDRPDVGSHETIQVSLASLLAFGPHLGGTHAAQNKMVGIRAAVEAENIRAVISGTYLCLAHLCAREHQSCAVRRQAGRGGGKCCER